ncbi:MAG: Mur ligase family protein [Pseudomonadota bacterium]
MPDANTPLPDWLAWLETLSPTEIDLGLERVQIVLERLDIERPKHVLLIGGTNGKGSSVAMAEALLLDAGYRTGAYTSPHIERYNERVRVAGVEVSDKDITDALFAVEAVRDDLPLTYFEFGTLAAFVVFATHGVDAWILEVGLGGRLDATNVVDPDASLITNVSLDHCEWLGDDVETIAVEKAGIMRAGKPVIFADKTVPATIRSQAAKIGASLILPEIPADLPTPGLIGAFQRRNAAGVLALLEAAGLADAVESARVARVLPKVTLAGRSQRLMIEGTQWLLDVAHNAAAAAVLAETLAADRRQTTAIIGVLDDKDLDGILWPLAALVSRWVAVEAESPRAISAAELSRRIANGCDKACLTAESMPQAIEYARRVPAENDRILVTGSFFTVGPALRQIKEFSS